MRRLLYISLHIAMITIGCNAEGTKLRVYLIDVANKTWVNESLLIVSPTGKTMLVDAGFSSDFVHGGNPYGQNIIRTFLKNLQIDRLDYILLTHPHDDHVGGVKELLTDDTIKVGTILYSPVPHSAIIQAEPGKHAGEYYVKLMKDIEVVAAKKSIPMQKVVKGQKIALGGDTQLEILAVADFDIDTPDFINNSSVVAMLSYKKFSMLLMGDAGYAREKALMKEYPNLKCDILKAGHHAGEGANSIRWLQHVSPSVAVVSAPEWLSHDPRGREGAKRFQKTKSPVLYTWKQGTLEIVSNGVTTTITPHGKSKPLLALTK